MKILETGNLPSELVNPNESSHNKCYTNTDFPDPELAAINNRNGLSSPNISDFVG